MTPANEGFGADQAAVGQTDLRLIEQFEFIARDGKRQFGLQRQPCFQFLPDLFLEQDVIPASCRLGATEREMAVAQQFVGGAAAQWLGGYSDTDLDPMETGPGQKRRIQRERDA